MSPVKRRLINSHSNNLRYRLGKGFVVPYEEALHELALEEASMLPVKRRWMSSLRRGFDIAIEEALDELALEEASISPVKRLWCSFEVALDKLALQEASMSPVERR